MVIKCITFVLLMMSSRNYFITLKQKCFQRLEICSWDYNIAPCSSGLRPERMD